LIIWKPRIAQATVLAVGAALVSAVPVPAQVWTQQGPGPIINGQSEGIVDVPGNNTVSGSITSLVIDPSDPTGNTVYVGAANGGVWKTTNFLTAGTPHYVPLTDFALPGLSINAIAMSPVAPNTVFAGTGSTSSYAFDGVAGFGIAKSSDGGATWSILGGSTFANRIISSVVPTALDGGNVLLASTRDFGGVFRSTNGGATFTQISGGAGTGLPAGGADSMVADPLDNNRMYAGLGGQGVYRSTDGGAHWTFTGGLPGGVPARILLSLHSDVTNKVVYAMGISGGGTLLNVYRFDESAPVWQALGVPNPPIFPGGQGELHGAIAADPNDVNVFFISGDRQNSPFPNVNGANNFSGNVFRGVFSVTGIAYQNAVMNGANGTSPHADSRAMLFSPQGDILQGNDGGIYRLNTPNNAATRRWVSRQGDITPTESHSAVFDPLSRVAFSGNQDTGTSIQTAPNALLWDDLLQGDGAIVDVDADQTAHPGTSIRYVGFTGLPFARVVYNSANAFVSFSNINYLITAGSGTGLTINQFDPNIQFYNPYKLNRIAPTRMLIGTANIYESLDKGATVRNFGFTGAFIGDYLGNSPISYGGLNANGTPNPGSFYISAGPTIFHRSMDGGSIVTLGAYPGSTVMALVSDPKNVSHVYVVDDSNRVWASMNEGATWTQITANLGALCPSARSVEIFSPSASPINTVLIVGGQGGVFQMRRPGAAGASWTAVSTGMPHALVYDLRYDYVNNVLVAGTLGRGVWTLANYFRGGITSASLGVQASGPSVAANPRAQEAFHNSVVQPPPAPRAPGAPRALDNWH
jgi:hypothetical protein